MESLIPIVNQLQEVISLAKVQIAIDLPRIVVVGSQSSGKSSVLESIVGKDFLPRGAGIVTRCPLILRLIRTDGELEYATFGHMPDCVFSDFIDVRNEIIEKSNEIAASEGISTREIFLNIYSSKVVDLTLIDLPGIIKIPLQGQAKNLDKRINQMISDYAQKENSIILAISPANSDLANSDSLNIARQVDPEGHRTIGVITKIDLMDRGTNAIEMIEGKLYPLKLGYVGVICRSQEDINNNVEIDSHFTKETHFFETSKIYGHMSNRLGIKYLSGRLSHVFKNHIQATIPKIKGEVAKMMEKNDKEMRDMGDTPDTPEKRNDLIYGIISSFSKKYADSLDGKDVEKCTTELLGGSMIRSIFRKFYNDIVKEIDPLKDLSDHEIRIAVMNATGVKGVMFVSEIAFEILVKDIIISKLKYPSLECLTTVKEELQKILVSLDIPEFKRFSKLKDFFIAMGYELIESQVPSAEKNIQNIIEIESSFLNISHEDFINPNDAMQSAQRILEDAAKKPKIEKAKVVEPKVEASSWILPWFSSAKNEEENKFEEIGKEKNNLRNLLNEEMTPKELEQILLIKILVDSYFRIVKLNISDSVPKAIMRNLVNKSRENLQRILTSRMYNNQEIYELILDEDPDVRLKRKNCLELRKSLASAHEILKVVIA